MISYSLEVEKQNESKSTKGAHEKFEPGSCLKILAEIHVFPPAHLERDENVEKKSALCARTGAAGTSLGV